MSLRRLLRGPDGPLPTEAELPLPGGPPVTLALRRSPRARRLSLRHLPKTGAIELVLPPRLRLEDALAFAATQGAWIRARSAVAHAGRTPFAVGAVIPVLGVPRRIEAAAGRGAPVELTEDRLLARGEPAHHARRIADHLKALARAEIAPRAQRHAAALGRRHGRISLRDPATRWGSCSAAGDLAFSWRLVMAPPSVLDYVVAHECAHLAELNHSDRFWRLVRELCPEMATAKAWLRAEGGRLLTYG